MSVAATGTAASFVTTDASTQGNWSAAYGTDGYAIPGDGIAYPSYGQVNISGNSFYPWTYSTTEPRGLQKVENPADRLAACWYSAAGPAAVPSRST